MNSNLNLNSSGSLNRSSHHFIHHQQQQFCDHNAPHSDANGNNFAGEQTVPPEVSSPPIPSHSHERNQSFDASLGGGGAVGSTNSGGSNQNLSLHKPQASNIVAAHHGSKQHEQQRLSHEQVRKMVHYVDITRGKHFLCRGHHYKSRPRL